MISARWFRPKNLKGPQADWWKKWQERADRALDALTKQTRRGRRKPEDWDETIWRDLKNWLLENVFFGKCAYCEALVNVVGYGDAEHYRPKGLVTTDSDGTQSPVQGHPGYWWLAYHWQNLLPACKPCNSEFKRNGFPVFKRWVNDPSLDPDTLDRRERPMLLNPYVDTPRDYLVFDELGCVGHRVSPDPGEKPSDRIEKAKRAAASIEFYGLNRPTLRDKRGEHARAMTQVVLLQSIATGQLESAVAPYAAGRKEYSQAVMDQIDAYFAKAQQTFARVQRTPPHTDDKGGAPSAA